jgi:hypothetical protein
MSSMFAALIKIDVVLVTSVVKLSYHPNRLIAIA